MGIGLAAPARLDGDGPVPQDVADSRDPRPRAGIRRQLAEVVFQAEARGQDQLGAGERPHVAGRRLERVRVDAEGKQPRHRHLGAAHLPGELG